MQLHRVVSRPTFDPTMTRYLENIRDEFMDRQRTGSLVEADILENDPPWMWSLTFHTRGLVRQGIEPPAIHTRHTVIVSFLPDYLRHVNRFDTLRLVEPVSSFHPNLDPPYICLEIYPGEPLVEICESLHGLFCWRIRQLCERDALNRDACVWGRANVDQLPLDNRPLFGRSMNIQLDPVEDTL